MEVKELLSLLVSMLKDEVIGSVEEKNGEIIVIFSNGTKRTVSVS